jgi:CYTH domain-containing protein
MPVSRPQAVGAPQRESGNVREGKYARIERERRFLLAQPPPAPVLTAPRRITDRYLPGTRLRLRRVDWLGHDDHEFKFTQKVPADRPGPVRGLITNTYLSESEYDLLARLPADVLSKTRYSLPPLAIDVFETPLHGLVLAEAEFSTDAEAEAFAMPDAAVAEVTDDGRFAGNNLARARRHDLLAWLGEYGINPDHAE